ncbi:MULTISPECIES: hypothetical protein [unclassified Novosphingobium]|uniref:DUF7064 domain-containing protein n=1 Tax=unclassified Novosphingobium TaxID=2644732 RepID=UPI00135CCFC1|nr:MULTISPECIES: hypothetical protein [unclassified Novosphingobium]
MIRYEATYEGQVLPFAPVVPEDDLLHANEADAPFNRVETYLLGFNVPEADINCNIYLLWHPALATMSAHVFVNRGALRFGHQLESAYFNEHLYLPAAEGPSRFALELGSLTMDIAIAEPLERLTISMNDVARGFALDLESRALLPPVGRPGGKHFTQLMHNRGELTLAGEHFAIDSRYVRDRSWGYQRPEQPEDTPPYRWITGWDDTGDGFVIAWLDTAMMGDAYASWRTEEAHARAANKWEHGGATPSVTLRSGWISKNGEPRAVRSVTIACEADADDPRMTRAIVLEVTDAAGDRHKLRAAVRQSYPKMYWGTMLTWMHLIELDWDGRPGHGDLMDTFSHWHMKG